MRRLSEHEQFQGALKIYQATQKPLKERVSEKAINHNATNPNDDLRTALRYAAVAGDTSLATFLLSKMSAKAINAEDKHAQTALHCAAQKGRTEIVRLLLDKMSAKAIDLEDRGGLTALDLALHSNHSSIVALIRAKSET